MSTAELAEHWTCDNKTYHSDTTSLSRSQHEDFRHSPALYESRHLLGIDPPEEGAALAFGTLVHAYLLEPDTILEIPRSVLSENGSRAGQAWKDFKAETSGKVLLKSDEFMPLRRICDSIDKHRWAYKLMRVEAGDLREHTIRWHDSELGIARRVRLDNVKRNHRIIADLKTTRSIKPKDFSRDSWTLGYHRQASYYMDGAEAMWPEVDWAFVFIAIEKTAPYGVEVFDFDGQFVRHGQEQNQRSLRAFAECQRSGIWSTESHGEIITLSPPTWAASDELWEVA